MKKIFLMALFSAVVLGVGCSVERGQVPHNPPNTDTDANLFGFKVLHGRMRSELASAFLWPVNWSERDYEIKVGKINRASAEMNAAIIENVLAKRMEINRLWYEFISLENPERNCRSEKFIMDLTEDELFALDEIVFSDDRWVPMPEVGPEDPGYDLYTAYQECRANQAQRVQLDAEINAFLMSMDEEGSKVKEAKELIAQELGEENSIPMNQDGVLIEYMPNGEVMIRVTNFNNSGITQRSNRGENRIKNVRLYKNRLSFTIPGVGDSAGKEYNLLLERVQNLGTFQKYVRDDNGDIRKVNVDLAQYRITVEEVAGSIKRTGAGQIIGLLEETL